VDLLERAGQVPLPAVRRPIHIEAAISVQDGTRWLRVFPCDTFRVSYTPRP
jgi:UDP-3-O-acyl-N-acetylglucosamine deacetylase